MQWASSFCETQQQGARRILVVGIILDDLGPHTGFANFLLADVPFNRAVKRMLAELEQAGGQLLLYLGKRFHSTPELQFK
jgi:hypothetical protein